MRKTPSDVAIFGGGRNIVRDVIVVWLLVETVYIFPLSVHLVKEKKTYTLRG